MQKANPEPRSRKMYFFYLIILLIPVCVIALWRSNRNDYQTRVRTPLTNEEIHGLEALVGTTFPPSTNSIKVYIEDDGTQCSLSLKVIFDISQPLSSLPSPWQRTEYGMIAGAFIPKWFDPEPSHSEDINFTREFGPINNVGWRVNVLMRMQGQTGTFYFESTQETANIPQSLISALKKYPDDRWIPVPGPVGLGAQREWSREGHIAPLDNKAIQQPASAPEKADVKLILDLLPPWTVAFEAKDLSGYLRTAKTLQAAPKIAKDLFEFIHAECLSDSPVYIDAAGKAFILLRIMFILPEDGSSGSYEYIDPFYRPDQMTTRDPSWPIRETGNEVAPAKLISSFQGMEGLCYNPADEYQHLVVNYHLRKLPEQ